ncbi:hypothetical protein ACFYUV_46885 [Nonomuraea sp. NPDC003560]|uniref:DUF3885 domain-containing protein n=1 Tax=Nonomuraea sp. NPDC003560 TaxID=3364341 RepID=UPI0036B2676B
MGMIVTDDEVESLTTAWRTRWGSSPIAHQLRGRHTDRCVRFDSLPESKRYADTEDEYEIILDRHHRVLAELQAEEDFYVIAVCFKDEEGRISPDPRHPGAAPWLAIEPGDDSPYDVAARLYASMASFVRQALDPLLRGVADGRSPT